MRKGSIIEITYDARPLVENVMKYKAEVIKETKTGFKVKNLDVLGRCEDVIFYPNGTARGWNTLTWTPKEGE